MLSPGGDSSSPFLLMPDVSDAIHIIQYWHEAGTFSNGGMGIVPLSWADIQAWMSINELVLDNYEISSIRRLSVEYVAEYHSASTKGRQAPYLASIDELDRPAAQSKFKSILSAFKKSNKTEDAKYTVEDNE